MSGEGAAARRARARARGHVTSRPRAAPTPDWLTDLVESLEKKIDLRVRLRRGRRTAEGGFEKGAEYEARCRRARGATRARSACRAWPIAQAAVK